MISVLVGGVGGAKLALGLTQVLSPDELTIIVNTADDLEWHGLTVSPDVDTVLYTLGGIANPETGWGIAGDTRITLEALGTYGLETWFGIGDRDLATHIARSEWLAAGVRYTDVVARLAHGLGIEARVLPMSDQPVRTMVHTDEGELSFQEYFVHRRTQVEINAISLAGIESAKPSPEVVDALAASDVIILAPSNPFVSIGPILALPGIRELLSQSRAARVAVSPIIGGKALKGPADRMLAQLGHTSSAESVARLYADIVDGFVLDTTDAASAAAIAALGIRPLVTGTIMHTLDDRMRVARETLAFARSFGKGSIG